MRLTEEAAAAVLRVMNRQGLDPRQVALEINGVNGTIKLAFTREGVGLIYRHGNLRVYTAGLPDGLVVDFGEVDGRQGFIFLGN